MNAEYPMKKLTALPAVVIACLNPVHNTGDILKRFQIVDGNLFFELSSVAT